MRPGIVYYVMSLLLAAVLTSCAATPVTPDVVSTDQPETASPESPEMEATMSLEVTSDVFVNGQAIPAKYACTGRNISPPLAWNDPPPGTQSFALIMDDPDAPMGTWVHWVLYNIPADARGLPEDLPVTGKNIDLNAIFVGKNSSGKVGYDGPCPPSGTHRYYFRLYALDTLISLLPGATKEQVLKEMDGHILAQGELMGTFSK
jgi:Raf kinase inhibitor-like YbhB/YbcL family protein